VAAAREQGLPALAALLAGAHRATCDGQSAVLWFDPSKANLIPMLNSSHHRLPLQKLLESCLGHAAALHCSSEPDPALQQAQGAREAAHAFVMADEKVRLALSLFKGEIIHLKQIGQGGLDDQEGEP
jgi:hypothetical protein